MLDLLRIKGINSDNVGIILLNFAQYISKVYYAFCNLYSEYNYIPKTKQVNEVFGKIHAD